VSKLELDNLDATEFEEFCFDLLHDMGFVNIDWRKGTALPSSPADRGRDIVAQLQQTDLDGTVRLETWFVSCKHHKRGVPPEKLQGTLAWARAERPNVVLIIASGFLSNPSKDHLADYERNDHPPFRIKYWEQPILKRLVADKAKLLQKYLLQGRRRESEILAAEEVYFDKIWYDRTMVLSKHQSLRERVGEDVMKLMLQETEEVRGKYGAENIGPYNDIEWGMLLGKLSALRWVLGGEWDVLDT